jgi:hypothetical protein
MLIKSANIFHCKTLQNWDFWFENIPSGNPGPQSGKKKFGVTMIGTCFKSANGKDCLVVERILSLYKFFVLTAFCSTIILFYHRFVLQSFWSAIVLFYHCFVLPSFCSTIVLFYNLFDLPSFCSTIFLIYHRFVLPSFCSTIILFYYHLDQLAFGPASA